MCKECFDDVEVKSRLPCGHHCTCPSSENLLQVCPICRAQVKRKVQCNLDLNQVVWRFSYIIQRDSYVKHRKPEKLI